MMAATATSTASRLSITKLAIFLFVSFTFVVDFSSFRRTTPERLEQQQVRTARPQESATRASSSSVEKRITANAGARQTTTTSNTRRRDDSIFVAPNALPTLYLYVGPQTTASPDDMLAMDPMRQLQRLFCQDYDETDPILFQDRIVFLGACPDDDESSEELPESRQFLQPASLWKEPSSYVELITDNSTEFDSVGLILRLVNQGDLAGRNDGTDLSMEFKRKLATASMLRQSAFMILPGASSWTDAQIDALAQHLSKDNNKWKVQVLVNYQPLYQWMSWLQADYHKRAILYNKLKDLRRHPAHVVLDAFAKHFDQIHVLPLHQLTTSLEQLTTNDGGKNAASAILKHVACAILQTAPNTCQAVTKGTFGVKKGRRKKQSSPPPPALKYLLVAQAAKTHNLVPADIDLNFVASRIQDWQAQNEVTDEKFFHLICPSSTFMQEFQALSWDMERRFYLRLGGAYSPQAAQAQHSQGFHALNGQHQYCNVHARMTITDYPTIWKQFLQRVVSEYRHPKPKTTTSAGEIIVQPPPQKSNSAYIAAMRDYTITTNDASECTWYRHEDTRIRTWGDQGSFTTLLEQVESNAHTTWAGRRLLILGDVTAQDLLGDLLQMILPPAQRAQVETAWTLARVQGYHLFPPEYADQTLFSKLYNPAVLKPLKQAGWQFLPLVGSQNQKSHVAEFNGGADASSGASVEFSWVPEFSNFADHLGFKGRHCQEPYDVVLIGKGLFDAHQRPEALTTDEQMEALFKQLDWLLDCLPPTTLVILRTPYTSTWPKQGESAALSKMTQVLKKLVKEQRLGSTKRRRRRRPILLLDGHFITSAANHPHTVDGHSYDSRLTKSVNRLLTLAAQQYWSFGIDSEPLSQGLWAPCGIGMKPTTTR